MREIVPSRLWIGSAGDASDLSRLLDSGIKAVVGLALEELPGQLIRDVIYCRFPLVDGTGNSPELLRATIKTTAFLVKQGIPTLISCSAGMSRSPAIAAAVLSCVRGRLAEDCLAEVAAAGPCDVSPGLWADIAAIRDAEC